MNTFSCRDLFCAATITSFALLVSPFRCAAQTATNSAEAAQRQQLQSNLADTASANLSAVTVTPAQQLAATNSFISAPLLGPISTSAASIQPATAIVPQEIQLQGGFAVAAFGPHKVRLGNPNSLEAVELTVPTRSGALQLRSHVVGICYYVPGTNESVLLAVPRETGGEIVGNQVRFTNALEGIDADIRYMS